MTATERPIIMSADSVRAILDGRQTQTRRVVKPQPGTFGDNWIWSYHHRGMHGHSEQIARFMRQHSPYPVGSRLWVRETWNTVPSMKWCAEHQLPHRVCYRADDGDDPPWRSPIFMPRWASRLTVEVVETTVEQQDGVWVWSTRVRRVQ